MVYFYIYIADTVDEYGQAFACFGGVSLSVGQSVWSLWVFFCVFSASDWRSLQQNLAIASLKDSDTLESFIVFLLSVLSLILLFSFLSANPIVGYLLKDYYTYSLKSSHTCRPLSDLVQGLFFESIQITSQDLECIMDFPFFLHISKTYHPIFNF